MEEIRARPSQLLHVIDLPMLGDADEASICISAPVCNDLEFRMAQLQYALAPEMRITATLPWSIGFASDFLAMTSIRVFSSSGASLIPIMQYVDLPDITGGCFHCLELPESSDELNSYTPTVPLVESNISDCDIQSARELLTNTIVDKEAHHASWADSSTRDGSASSSSQSDVPPDMAADGPWYNPWDIAEVVHRHSNTAVSNASDSSAEIDEQGLLCMPGLKSVSYRFGVEGCADSKLDWTGCFIYNPVLCSPPGSNTSEYD